MTPKEKARELVNEYRVILMNEDTDCGNEILCTSIAKKCALIAVDAILNTNDIDAEYSYYLEVKQEIENL